MMALDVQFVANLIALAGFAIVGYLYKSIIDDQKTLSADQKADRQGINDLRIELPSKYVSKDDLTQHLNRIEAMLNKIFERLEQKADK